MATFPQITSPPQASAEVVVNEAFETVEHVAVYGKRHATTTGLTWGYYGSGDGDVRWSGFAIADGTVSLTNASANYLVVARATGVLSTSTSNTNWNNTTDYVRVYKITTAGSVVTAVEDHRAGPGGTSGASATSGGTVTHTAGALTASALMVGNGTDDAKVLASLGTTTTLLHGNAAGLPTFAAVSLTADVSGSLPLANGGTSGTDVATARTALALVPGTNVQAWDADLDTLAGLTATTDNFLQAKSSAWASRTVAQVTADLQGTGLLTDAAGFRTIPQNSQSTAYGCVAADSGKHILHPSADTTARTMTIPANGSVAYPIGTAITFINQASAGVMTIAITSDTMRLAGPGTTGSRTLAANGICTAVKITATEWIISGTGLT